MTPQALGIMRFSRVIASCIVAMAALAGVVNGFPTLWSPLNVLGMIPAFWASIILGPAAIAVPSILFGIAFALWCPNVWSGAATVPRRSIALAVVAILLSILNVTGGRDYGLQYQGEAYVRWVTAVSIVAWALVIGLFVAARRRPSPQRNLWFHLVLFSWLGWYAIPYMGELP